MYVTKFKLGYIEVKYILHIPNIQFVLVSMEQ